MFAPVSQWPVHRILLRACRGWVNRYCYNLENLQKVQVRTQRESTTVSTAEFVWICLAGWYEDSVFHVNGFGFPPTEPSSATRWIKDLTLFLPYSWVKSITVTRCSITRAYYGNMNFFGGPSSTSVKASAKLKQLEEENEDAMFVIISDVWLDDVEVLEKLNLMFSGQLVHHESKLPTCGWILFSLCFFFQVTLRCLPPVLFWLVTSLPRPMETRR